MSCEIGRFLSLEIVRFPTPQKERFIDKTIEEPD